MTNSVSYYEPYNTLRYKLAMWLVDAGVVNLVPFSLNLHSADNPTAPWSTNPDLVNLAACCMRSVQVDKGSTFDAVIGMPGVGEILASAFAGLANRPCIALGVHELKGKRQIVLNGLVPENMQKVLVVDAMIGEKDLKLEVTRLLWSMNINVTDIAVLIDCEHGECLEEFDDWGCAVHMVFTNSNLAQFYIDAEMMPRPNEVVQPSLSSNV